MGKILWPPPGPQIPPLRYYQYFTGDNIAGLKISGDRVSSFFWDELIMGGYLSRLYPLAFALLLRRKNTKNTLFVSTIEAHGSYSPVTEFAINSNSSIKELKVVLNSEEYTAIAITNINDVLKLFITSNKKESKDTKHTVKINGKNYNWRGSYHYK